MTPGPRGVAGPRGVTGPRGVKGSKRCNWAKRCSEAGLLVHDIDQRLHVQTLCHSTDIECIH